MNETNTVFYLTNISEQTINKENIIPMSTDKDEYVLIYVLDGQGTVYYDKDFLGIKHHDLLIINLQKDFYYSSDDMEIFIITFGGTLLKEILPNEFLFTIHNHQEFYERLRQMKKDEHSSTFIKIKHFIKLIEFLYDHKNTYTIKQSLHPMQKAIHYIEENFNQKIDIEDISSHCGFSSYYFIRKFKEYSSKTPYQYLLHMRLEHAKYLLKYTNKQIIQVAKESGFKSDISFINSFTKHMQISPTTFRKTKEK